MSLCPRDGQCRTPCAEERIAGTLVLPSVFGLWEVQLRDVASARLEKHEGAFYPGLLTICELVRVTTTSRRAYGASAGATKRDGLGLEASSSKGLCHCISSRPVGKFPACRLRSNDCEVKAWTSPTLIRGGFLTSTQLSSCSGAARRRASRVEDAAGMLADKAMASRLRRAVEPKA